MQNAIARRYARALFQVAREQGSLDAVASDLQLISKFLEDPALKDLLEHQRISSRRKKEIVRALWEKLVSRTVMAFIELLVDKHRERYLGGIAQIFADLLRAERNIAVAEVKTAFPFDPEAEARVRQVLEKHFGKQIELKVSVHPELIGGMVVKVGDRIIDGSVTRRLALMGTRLADRSLGKLEVGT